MRPGPMYSSRPRRSHRRTAGVAALLVVALAACKAAEWRFGFPYELWWFWLFAVAWAHRALIPSLTVFFSLGGAAAANEAGLWAGQPDGILRFAVMAAVFTGASLGLGEALRQRARAVETLAGTRARWKASRAEAARFRTLIDSTSMGIMTVSARGQILTANDAAHRLLSLEPGQLPGRYVTSHLPPLGGLQYPAPDEGNRLRAAMECRAWRRDGMVFDAQVHLSQFQGPAGPELGVLFCDRTVWALEEDAVPLLHTYRIGHLAACADLHEIRNLSFAVGALCREFQARPDGSSHELLRSLQDLAIGLGRLAGHELRAQSEGGVTRLDLHQFAGEARALLAQIFAGTGVELQWEAPPDLPPVWADPEGLLQVLLNLAQNSRRAFGPSPAPRVVSIRATANQGHVLVHFCDSAAAPERPEVLFHPVVRGPDVMNLGLYIARALLHSFGGDLRYRRQGRCACFVLELLTADTAACMATGAATAA